MTNQIVKYIRRQDSGWKQAAGCSGETSINLSQEILEFLTFGMVDTGEECGVTFIIYRDDYVNALSYIKTQLPLYRSTSREYSKITEGSQILKTIENGIYSFFCDDESKEYTVTLYRRKDGRIYLKGLKQKGFTIRDFLLEYGSAIVFNQSDMGFELRVYSAVYEGEIIK